MGNRLISVIIPVYNASLYLSKCLESVLKQTYQNIEIICINDGSTDDSEMILEKYKRQNERKITINTIPNEGQANARNIGIDISNGEYICFVDSDDTLEKDMLENMLKASEDHNSDVVVCGINRIFEGGVSFLEKKFNYDPVIEFLGTTTIYEHPEIICYLKPAPFAKLIRKEFLNQNKIRFIKGYIYEDLVFTQTILSYNPKITLLKDAYYRYLVRNNSTMTSKKSCVTDMFISYDNLYKAYKKNGRDLEFNEELNYLCLYHVMIGTSYRMWRSGQYGLVKSISTCRNYIRERKCNRNNIYWKKEGLLTKLFLKIMLF